MNNGVVVLNCVTLASGPFKTKRQSIIISQPEIKICLRNSAQSNFTYF